MPIPTSDQITPKEWSDNYKIDTPTFELSPIEKPDMSPFLIHMTGKNEIVSILEGQGTELEIAKGCGYLQANIPEYYQKKAFDAKVVCFSESPTFALDFFRYRSIERWKANQSFGIGFAKSEMVAIGARPVIYVEDNTLKHIINLFHRVRDDSLVISNDAEVNARVTFFLSSVYPLLYPLLENHPSQGFMWEREWRYTNPDGLVFDHKTIRIICCPPDEEGEIRKALSPDLHDIAFIHTWQEYDDVTAYLVRQEREWGINRQRFEESITGDKSDEAMNLMRNLIQQYTLAYNSLDSYEAFVSDVSQEIGPLKKQKEHLKGEISQLIAKLDELEKKKSK
jgi:hypothetical protein